MDNVRFIDKYPGETVRALSWKQPYASMMLHGKAETRVWDTKYRGWVLICASQRPYSIKETHEISGQEQFDRIFRTLVQDDQMLFGKAIAVGYLFQSRLMGHYSESELTRSIAEDHTFVKFNPDLYMHYYGHVQAIEPFDWKGKQGWSTLDEETKSKIILI